MAETLTESAANYWYWKNKGRCVRCHCQDALTLNGRAYCGDCGEKRRNRAIEYAQTHNRNAANREQYRRKRETGLCVKCGKPALPGKARCLECAVKLKERDRQRNLDRHKDTNFPRGGNGVCYMCNKKPVMTGQRLCPGCAAICRDNLPLHPADNHAIAIVGVTDNRRGRMKHWKIIEK